MRVGMGMCGVLSLLCCSALLVLPLACSAASSSERSALLTLYQQLGGSAWSSTTGWTLADDTCTWSGVTCSPPGVAAVTALKLSGQGLVGVFPNATVWRALPNLTTVDLSYNSISGSFTPLLSVGAALTSITLPNNALSGPLPTSEWMYCPNLTTIYLSNNQISGVLPAQIAQLTQLTWLAISYNSLTGPLPVEYGALSSMQVFAMGGNSLSGPLPSSYGAWTSAYLMALEDCGGLTGSIPDSWQAWTGISTFGVYGNQLSGTLPPWIGAWSSVSTLSLNNNKFSGSPFPLLCSLSRLSSLQLQGNSFSGSLSACIGQLSALTLLNIGDNALSGPLPATLGALSALATLDASNNALTSSNAQLPRSMINMTALKQVDLSNNPLGIDFTGVEGEENSGGIEPLAHLPALTTLDLSGCALQGDMSSLALNAPGHQYSAVWTGLIQLKLANNNLRGKPSGGVVGSMGVISYLDISNNTQLAGNLDDLAALTTLLATGLPNVAWSGALPSGIVIDSSKGYIEQSSSGLAGVWCPQFTGATKSLVFQIDGWYSHYDLCSCMSGYYGVPPSCLSIPNNVSAATSAMLTALAPLEAGTHTSSAVVRALSDTDYGNHRSLLGMDLVLEIDASSASVAISVITLYLQLNRTYFSTYSNLLEVYSGDGSLTGTRMAQMRGVDSYMQTSVQSSATAANPVSGSTQTAVVFGPKAALHFTSRDTDGQHFVASYSLSTTCPQGYIADPVLYCTPLQPLFQIDAALQRAVYAVNGIVMALIVGLLLFNSVCRNHPVLRSSSPLFNGVVLLGLLLGCLAGIVWALPVSIGVCHARGWLTPFALCTTMASVLVKTDRIKRIFNLKQLKQINLPNTLLVQIMLCVMLPQLALSVAFSGVPMVAAGEEVGSGSSSGYRVSVCHTAAGFQVWYAVQLTYLTLLLAYSLWNAFRTRNVPSAFRESQWLAAAVYLVVLLMLLGLPLQLLVSDSPNGITIINGLGLAFAALSLALVLFGHKVYTVMDSRTSVHQVGGTQLTALQSDDTTDADGHAAPGAGGYAAARANHARFGTQQTASPVVAGMSPMRDALSPSQRRMPPPLALPVTAMPKVQPTPTATPPSDVINMHDDKRTQQHPSAVPEEEGGIPSTSN